MPRALIVTGLAVALLAAAPSAGADLQVPHPPAGAGRRFRPASRPLPPDDTFGRVALLRDFDGDGRADLFVGATGEYNAPERNRLFLNGKDGTWAEAPPASLPSRPRRTHDADAGDVDGDGDLDLVLANPPFGLTLLINDGAGRFADQSSRRLLAEQSSVNEAVRLFDADGDGDLDLFAGDSRGSHRLLLNDGRGGFSLGWLDSAGDIVLMDIEAGDLDGDGDLDLVLAVFNGPNGIYLNDGRGRFSEAPVGSLPPECALGSDASLGDVDGDGDLDLALAYYGRSPGLYLNDGRGAFSAVPPERLPRRPLYSMAILLGDLDGDSDLDLVVTGTNGELTGLSMNDGSGAFAPAPAGYFPEERGDGTDADLADLDGDGDQDLLVTHGRGPNLLYEQTAGPLDAVPPTIPGNLAVTALSPTALEVTYAPSSDNVGVLGYNVFIGESLSAFTRETRLVDNRQRPATDYCFTVEALDGSGNHSARSAPVCATTPSWPVMAVSSIVLSAAEDDGGSRLAVAVEIVDGAGSAVAGALVRGSLGTPGAPAGLEGLTDAAGRADLSWRAAGGGLPQGIYTFTVTGLSKPGHDYSPALDRVSRKSLRR